MYIGSLFLPSSPTFADFRLALFLSRCPRILTVSFHHVLIYRSWSFALYKVLLLLDSGEHYKGELMLGILFLPGIPHRWSFVKFLILCIYFIYMIRHNDKHMIMVYHMIYLIMVTMLLQLTKSYLVPGSMFNSWNISITWLLRHWKY